MMPEAMIIQQPSGAARQLVLLFHGLGASEEDLRPLGERLAAEYPEALVASLRAPHPTSLGIGYQWFSVEGIDDARRVERVAAEMPLFMAAIRQWQRDTGLGPEATVLVGFSQGAIMVLEAATQAGDDVLAGRVVALAGRYARLPATNPGGTTLFLDPRQGRRSDPLRLHRRGCQAPRRARCRRRRGCHPVAGARDRRGGARPGGPTAANPRAEAPLGGRDATGLFLRRTA